MTLPTTTRQLFSLCGLLALLLGACSPTVAEPEPTAPPVVLPTAVNTAVPIPTDPPPTATLPPTSTPLTEEVIQLETEQSGTVWLIRPQGLQCEGNQFEDLKEAVNALTSRGVTVLASEEISLNVLAVCGAPTSTHYRVQIGVSDVDTAVGAGWTEE